MMSYGESKSTTSTRTSMMLSMNEYDEYLHQTLNMSKGGSMILKYVSMNAYKYISEIMSMIRVYSSF